MQALLNYRQKLIEQNKKEYGIFYNQLKNPGYYQGLEAEDARNRIISEIMGKVGYLFNGTKPFAHDVSPGCKLCGEGKWSCLFVNNRCNCNCFYCPAPQNETSLPETQGFTFENPDAYIEYIRKMGFKGVSLSGGEPLLTFDKTLNFLTEIKKVFGNEVYLWIYTNGTLLTEEKVQKLADAGLDEIRFDLTATNYNTKNLKLALGKIPAVTVEIPAIPDEIEELKHAVIELDKLGVNFLNLHQMRLTPHNLKNLLHRNYTFLHGQKVTVLESELTALEIIRFVLEKGLRLPVNYCSFHYKNHYQKAGFRKIILPFVADRLEEVTENGYLRRISISPGKEKNAQIITQLKENFSESSDWLKCDGSAKIILTRKTLMDLHPLIAEAEVEYFTVNAGEIPVYGGVEIVITPDKKFWIEKSSSVPSMAIDETEMAGFLDILDGKEPESLYDSENLFRIAQKELPARGFTEYF